MSAAIISPQITSDEPGNVKVLKSVCRSCHGGCSTLMHVSDGELLKVEGDPEGPLNHGKLCPIGAATTELVYHPDRLKYPQRRIGPRGSGKWERITWDEALDEISERVLAIREETGPESIAMGTGTGRHHIRWVSRFGHALGTPNWCEPGFAQCFHPRVNTCIQTMGDLPVCDFTGDVDPELIMYWGHNPPHSGPDGETRFNVRESLLSKPRIITIDPRQTVVARKAELWLQIRPGTDDALALAFINVIINEDLYDREFCENYTHGFEELAAHVHEFTPEWAEPITWVPADKIRAAARLFAELKPAMLEWGLCDRAHAEHDSDSSGAVVDSGAHRQHRRPRRLDLRHEGRRALPEPDREPRPRGRKEATRLRQVQDALRRGRGPARLPHSVADRCDALR